MMNKENSNEYYFSDFTLDAYSELLSFSKENYNFCDYTNFNSHEDFLLWRHDLDFSIPRALKLAKIEKKFEITATYFIHLHNGSYNIFDKKITQMINEIAELGHKLGIHLDASYYDIENENQLISCLEFESQILKRLFGETPAAFSFHEPSKKVLKNFTEFKYNDMVNTYSKFFQKEVTYCSDSNGIWRFVRLKDLLHSKKHTKLQILTHPVWWTETPLSPNDRIKTSFEFMHNLNLDDYRSGRKSRNRPLID